MSTQTVTVRQVHGESVESTSWSPVIAQLRAHTVDVVMFDNQDLDIPPAALRNMAECASASGTPEDVGESFVIGAGAPDQVAAAIFDAVAATW